MASNSVDNGHSPCLQAACSSAEEDTAAQRYRRGDNRWKERRWREPAEGTAWELSQVGGPGEPSGRNGLAETREGLGFGQPGRVEPENVPEERNGKFEDLRANAWYLSGLGRHLGCRELEGTVYRSWRGSDGWMGGGPGRRKRAIETKKSGLFGRSQVTQGLQSHTRSWILFWENKDV